MKRYSVNYYLRKKYGEKIYKLALRGGVSCPNRDGSVAYGGCIFCSAGGSGEFASETVDEAVAKLAGKKTGNRFIAYYQDYSVTYNTADNLRNIFREALERDDIVIISVGTRPDCLGPDIVELLSEMNRIKPVWVELGIQTSNEKTAELINRGYHNIVFEYAVKILRQCGIEVIAHLIIGLPGEDKNDLAASVRYISGLDVQGVKLHLLHVLTGTELEKMYLNGDFVLPGEEEYAELVCMCLKELREDIIVHRYTGDGPKKILVAPKWSGDKKHVLNMIRRSMKKNGIELL